MRFRGRSRQRGQSLVETALILPIFLLLVVAIFDLGRAVFMYSTVGNAARQGARVAIVNQLTSASECDQRRPVEDPAQAHWAPAECAVLAGSAVGVTLADVSVSYSTPPGSTLTCSIGPPVHVQVGCLASVAVQTTWRPITPLIGNIVGPITLRGTSEMPVERVFP